MAVTTEGPAKLEVAVSEVVDYMRINGDFAPALADVAERKIAAAAARDQGFEVSDEELQRAADRFRLKRDLRTADDTTRWLEASGLTVMALERFLETNILISKLKNKLQREAGELLESREVTTILRELAYRRWLDSAWE